MPSGRFPYLEFETPIPFAHRGGTSEHPENTMPAFQNAVDLGYRYLETDVHATSDGVLVAFHDDSLDRVTDKSGKISELSWAEVSTARIDGSEPIPLMADLFASFPEARFNIDIKAKESIAPLAKLITETGAIDRVCVGAFSDFRLKTIRDLLGPNLCTSLGPLGILALRAASMGTPSPALAEPGGFLSAGAAQVPVKSGLVPITDERFVAKSHELGLQVHVWTIDDPGDMQRLLDIGVDGVMTDQPQVLKDVLIARDAWSE